MATVTATELSLDSSLEQFKEQFNKLRTDVSGVTLASLGFSEGVVFEGATVDDFETTLTATDPTADRTITLPDAAGTVALTSDITLSTLSVTASATELNYNDITTLGTVEASKTVTADASGNVLFTDSDELRFGTGSDLSIYHDGSNSYIKDSGTGNLNLLADGNVNILNAAATEFKAQFVSDGAVNLFYDNLKKFETTSAGISVTGDAAISGNATITGNLTVNGSTVTNSATNTTIEDVLIELGTGTTSASSDAGIVIERGSTGDNVFLGWDESADQVIFGTTTATGASSGDLTITPGSTRVSGLIVNDSGTIGPATTTNALTFASNGNATFTGTIAATATATLLIKNSGGTTLKTINGIG
jgi:hypothetical protein